MVCYPSAPALGSRRNAISILVTGLVWKNSRHDGSALLLLLAIADYADDHGIAWPSIAALRRKARLGKTACYEALIRLKGSGELEILESGGGRKTSRYRVITTPGEQLVMLPKGAPRIPPKPKRTGPHSGPVRNLDLPFGGPQPSAERTAPVLVGGPVTVTEPSSEPSELPRAPRATAPMREPTPKEIARIEHAFGKAAEEAWQLAASKVGNDYVTRPHIRQVHDHAIRSLQWATEKQILHAISTRLERDSAPIRIPEWARLEAADDSEREHTARKMAEREERRTIVEAHGNRWLGHEPVLSGDRCVVAGCGRALNDHKLAEPSSLRELPFGRVVEEARNRVH